MHGAFFLPCSNISRTRLAPTPTNISTKSDPEIVKNGTLASPAIARASNVLPVPGGPTRRHPFGSLPPSRWNFAGSFRKSTISSNSCLASSIPATSSNVTRSERSVSKRARDFPKPMALPPPPCIWRIKNIHTPKIMIIGSQERIIPKREGTSSSTGRAVMRTPFSVRPCISEGSSGAKVRKDLPAPS